MILLLVICFWIIAIIFILWYRSSEVKYLGFLLLSLSLMMLTVLIYMAKKGGINNELLILFFINRKIRHWMQYLNITLNHLGFTMAIGRTLFPFVLFKIGMNYSMWTFSRKYHYLSKWLWTIPCMILVFYWPSSFRMLVGNIHAIGEIFLWLSNGLLIVFTLIGLSLLFIELFSIDLMLYRKQFGLLTVFMSSLTVIYFLYFLQEPTQVYRFHQVNYFWQQGLFYLYSVPVRMYIFLLLITIISAIISIFSLTKYTHNIFVNNQHEMQLKQRKQTLSPVITMFIHGIKNQFLAHQIIQKRLISELQTEDIDREKCLNYVKRLSNETDDMLFRMNRVYRSLKDNQAILKPRQASDVVYAAIQKTLEHYPDCSVNVNLTANPTILVDDELMSEAMSNLLINAYESIMEKESYEDNKISVNVKTIRAFILFEFRDTGKGMSEKEIRKIFTPFFSNKNSKTNWGLGLYFVREIVKSHFGGIYLESQLNKGSCFTVYLPKYKESQINQE